MATLPNDDHSTAVATFAPPRLPYHPGVKDRFGVDQAGWRALVDAVFPMAKTQEAVILALSYCRARELDPFKRMVHIVPMWNSALGREVETVWPGIGEHRATAMRTGQFGGCDDTKFGERRTLTFDGRVKDGKDWKDIKVNVEFPEWAQVTVYRVVQGQRMPVPGPRVYWIETYSKRGRADVPNDRWCRAPSQMIEKCAEAAALRKAFPEELGDTMSAEEAEGRETTVSGAADQIKDVTPPSRPTRAQFEQEVMSNQDRPVKEAGPEPGVPTTPPQVVGADLDAEYNAMMSGRLPDEPEHDADGVVVEPATATVAWSTDIMKFPNAKPTPKEVADWCIAFTDHIRHAPNSDPLAVFLSNNAKGTTWVRTRYATEGDLLQEAIDEATARVSP